MARKLAILGGCTSIAILALAAGVEAGRLEVVLLDPSPIERAEGRLGRLHPPTREPHATQHGSTIVADATGLWIAERNAGALIRANHDGGVVATIPLHEGLGEIVHDPAKSTLFVADRRADRVLRFSIAGDQATQAAEFAVVEPHGLALTPDGATLLITSVADRELVAVDAATFALRWRVALLPEPRAVAVSPDGSHALVGFLTSGSIARVDLASAGERITWQSLSPRDEIQVERDDPMFGGETVFEAEAASRFVVPNDVGRRHARNVFAIGFVGDGIAVIAHQVSTPQMKLVPDSSSSDSYGGGPSGVAPAEYWQTRIAEPGPDGLSAIDQLRLPAHQPRALAYDAERDILYVGGHGDDELLAIARASQQDPTLSWSAGFGQGVGQAPCGIDGLALVGNKVFVHCELARRVVRIDLDPESRTHQPIRTRDWVRGPELAPSLRDKKVEKGADLFRRGEAFFLGGALACSGCHPEGRSDGLSWRLGKSILQTPILAGRVGETAPYKWTGEDRNLHESFKHTLERIGGSPDFMDDSDYDALEAYLTSLPEPRPPTIRDAAAVDRGKAVFERECSDCHAGERSTDREQHEFATSLAKVDTPSLIGVAHSAPYYHDGSAIDLATLLDDRGSIHDMVDTSALSGEQRADLIAYLESL
jgi:DNA-binding beta-propeller fold protein YncE/mono/diheme cytochrome c family protein